jgi:hypothetical protein
VEDELVSFLFIFEMVFLYFEEIVKFVTIGLNVNVLKKVRALLEIL